VAAVQKTLARQQMASATSLGALDYLYEAPPLMLAVRAALRYAYRISFAGGIFLIVCHQARRALDELAVDGMFNLTLDRDRYGLVHLIANNYAYAGLPRIAGWGGGLFVCHN